MDYAALMLKSYEIDIDFYTRHLKLFIEVNIFVYAITEAIRSAFMSFVRKILKW